VVTLPERTRIGLREIRALKPGTEIWDGTVRGFGARRRRTAAVSYVVMYRTDEGRLRRYTIGRHGAPWTPDTARNEALRTLGEKVTGNDPAAAKRAKGTAETVADLCDLYWEDAESGNLVSRRRSPKKISTLLSDKSRIEKHIKPLLGSMKVTAVNLADVEAFMRDVTAGKTAGRAKTTKKRGLSNVRGAEARPAGGAIFSYAVRKGIRSANPVHGITRPADGRRERRLTEEEYRALGAALRAAEERKIWPAAVAAVRFLAVSGWRTGEALALKRSEVDLARRTVILVDSKSGRSLRPLSYPACEYCEV
jgi:Arm DNA-binding domain